MIRCSVCQDKKKNRVITKCFHMFCDGCLEQSIKVHSLGLYVIIRSTLEYYLVYTLILLGVYILE